MKVEVIKEFVDKRTDDLRKVGEVFEVSATRLKEIQSKGEYVKVVSQSQKGKK